MLDAPKHYVIRKSVALLANGPIRVERMGIAECDDRRLSSESLSLLAVTVDEEGSSAIFGDLSL